MAGPEKRELVVVRSLARMPWPRSLAGKTILVAVVAAHLPLLALLGWTLVAPPQDVSSLIPIILVTFAATILCTLLTLALVISLLTPMLRATSTLDSYMAQRRAVGAPACGEDAAVPELAERLATTLSQLDEQMRRFELASSTDGLTAVYNRRAGQLRLTESLAALGRGGPPFLLAVLDVDGLKAINDRHGHQAGDTCLVQLARTLREHLRGSDWLARWGGDEFILGIHASRAEAEKLAERVLMALASTWLPLPDATVALSASLGMAEAQVGESAEALFRRADRALYAAKNDGRGRYRVAEDGTSWPPLRKS